jgi:DNA-binding response OmpR family regulator
VGALPGRNGQARKQPVRRIVLTNRDVRVLEWLHRALRASDVDILLAENGVELERALLDGGPFELVVATAWIAGPTGLQVLAKARVRGIRTPFVIVTSLSGDSARLMVSDGGHAAVSSRVVDPEGFVSLVLGLMRPRSKTGSIRCWPSKNGPKAPE